MASLKDIHIYDPLPNVLPRLAHEEDPRKTCSILLLENGNSMRLNEINLINTGYIAGKYIDLREQDIVCVNIPFHYSAGQSLGLGMTLAHKAVFVIPSEVFDVESTLSCITRDRCTVIQGLSSQFESILASDDISKHDLSTLKKAVIAVYPGEPIPTPESIQSLKTKLGVEKVLVTYGIQRSGGVILMENDYQTKGTFSIVPDQTSVRLVDNKSNVVHSGTSGSLEIKGFHIDNHPDEQNKWQSTGIKATFDDVNEAFTITDALVE
eukprot:TRINITY_DN1680_c0_g1_i2.p1 TRINITY_DN1680_c0_g1~~TRINITY_DN1680_c0_g1_i2.p1  ORF type:complete len:266 (-),score=34.72 TRINITY_DN1680_c0_g1_i2:79-876(-)